jgi:integrase
VGKRTRKQNRLTAEGGKPAHKTTNYRGSKMTTSKLTTALTADFSKDYIGINPDVLNGIISKAIALYETKKVLKIQETENSGAKRTYYLVKRPSVKQGFIYQVKYLDPETNAILPTKYSTGTNDFETAVKWAEANKEKCLENYNGRAELTILENYFMEGSKYLEYEKMDGRELLPKVINDRRAFMVNHIIPFFQGEKVRYLNQITPIHIKLLKDYLSKKGLTPQTINYNLHSFKKCLILLKDMGKISYDFSGCSFSQKGSKEAEKTRNIYAIDTLKGVFSKQWENGLSKLLCEVIYFTGMRNSEIQRMRFNDIQKMNDVFFLNVRGTKSKNAVRAVPIHPALYNGLERYVNENGIDRNTPIFSGAYNDVFRKASFDMGSMLGFTEKELIKKGVCFYSGRHTYKTILALGNAEKIADVSIDFQEMFMGHNFKKAELKEKGINEYAYKHLNADVIGSSLLTEKGKEVIKILTHYYL